MLIEVGKVEDIAPGGMKAVEANGKEIVICNFDGKIYAVSRRCGHMNAPLEMGTLNGYILTCPMHHSQFDIITGEALSGTIPADLRNELPEDLDKYMRYISMLISHIKICNIKIYPIKIDGNSIKVEV